MGQRNSKAHRTRRQTVIVDSRIPIPPKTPDNNSADNNNNNNNNTILVIEEDDDELDNLFSEQENGKKLYQEPTFQVYLTQGKPKYPNSLEILQLLDALELLYYSKLFTNHSVHLENNQKIWLKYLSNESQHPLPIPSTILTPLAEKSTICTTTCNFNRQRVLEMKEIEAAITHAKLNPNCDYFIVTNPVDDQFNPLKDHLTPLKWVTSGKKNFQGVDEWDAMMESRQRSPMGMTEGIVKSLYTQIIELYQKDFTISVNEKSHIERLKPLIWAWINELHVQIHERMSNEYPSITTGNNPKVSAQQKLRSYDNIFLFTDPKDHYAKLSATRVESFKWSEWPQEDNNDYIAPWCTLMSMEWYQVCIWRRIKQQFLYEQLMIIGIKDLFEWLLPISDEIYDDCATNFIPQYVAKYANDPTKMGEDIKRLSKLCKDQRGE